MRQQVLVSLKNREISDVALRQTIATTMRTVRNAYWNLAYATASLGVQRQSLELAQESLRNTRSRVEIGTTPPIDIVEAESEVATREEAVIVAEAQIKTVRRQPARPDFRSGDAGLLDDDDRSRSICPRSRRSPSIPTRPCAARSSGAPTCSGRVKSLEVDDLQVKFLKNQTLPDVTANFDYGLSGLGGLQLVRGVGPFGPGSGAVVGENGRSFAATMGDLFANRYPAWTASVNVTYPLGTSPAEAELARARIEYNQGQTQLKSQQLQVSTQVREAARQVQTNQKRVETTRAARSFADRRLEAEQRKFQAGTSTSFIVFQAQRDLAQARNNELRAILDYAQSVVDLETVQEVPLNGGGATAP